MEIWKPIERLGGVYEVSNKGRVRTTDRYVKCQNGQRLVRGIIKKQTLQNGYCIVTINMQGKYNTEYVHRLIAEAFIENPNNYKQINHKDENKQNNCVENLEWCNSKYNINYGTRTERAAKKRSKPVLQCDIEGNKIKMWESLSEIGRMLGYSPSNIMYACNGKFKTMYGYTWRFC